MFKKAWPGIYNGELCAMTKRWRWKNTMAQIKMCENFNMDNGKKASAFHYFSLFFFSSLHSLVLDAVYLSIYIYIRLCILLKYQMHTHTDTVIFIYECCHDSFIHQIIWDAELIQSSHGLTEINHNLSLQMRWTQKCSTLGWIFVVSCWYIIYVLWGFTLFFLFFFFHFC